MDVSTITLTALVVDDSKTIRILMSGLLGKMGISVLTASNGFSALATVVDEKPDLIFMDIAMPRLDGYRTCAIIRNNPALKKIPIIMLSSQQGIFDKAKARVVGCDQYLTKPFKKQDLINVVTNILGG